MSKNAIYISTFLTKKQLNTDFFKNVIRILLTLSKDLAFSDQKSKEVPYTYISTFLAEKIQLNIDLFKSVIRILNRKTAKVY